MEHRSGSWLDLLRRYRHELGLKTDEASMARVAQQGSSEDRPDTVLLPEERPLDRRNRAEMKLVRDYVHEHAADDCVGVELEDFYSGRIGVWLIRNVEHHGAVLRGLVSQGRTLRCRPADFSPELIDAEADRMVRELREDPPPGFQMVSVGPTDHGTIGIEAIAFDAAAASEAIHKRYGAIAELHVISNEPERLEVSPWIS